MLDVTMLSGRYDVRRLGEADADAVLRLCRENPQYYRYSEAKPTKEQVLSDLRVTPPGIGPEDKYYVGFFEDGRLAAVMDLIDGYPARETAYIGFFMMRRALQGRGLGSEIVREAAAYLKTQGKTSIRLGIDGGNPQSAHFWRKNGFAVIREAPHGGRTVLVAEKTL